MNTSSVPRGGMPVGAVTDLDPVGAGAVICLRLWGDGPDRRSELSDELSRTLGLGAGQRAAAQFNEIFALCAHHRRRPLMRHALSCECLGADEACFAAFVSAAADGAREDAMMMALLMVRPDLAPALTDAAQKFGLALRKMQMMQMGAGAHTIH